MGRLQSQTNVLFRTTMVVFPQALALVVQQLIFLLYPAVLTLALCSILDSLFNADVPTWAYALIAIASTPVSLAGRIWFHDWLVAHKAARVGAILAPRWDGKAIGNTDLLKLLMGAFETGYISKVKYLQVTGHLLKDHG